MVTAGCPKFMSSQYRINMERKIFTTTDRVHTYRQDASEDGPTYYRTDRDIQKKLPIEIWDDVPVTIMHPSKGRQRCNDTVVLYAHGSGWDLARLLDRPFLPTKASTKSAPDSLLQIIADAFRLTVIAFEYPGYGAESADKLSIDVTVERMVKVYENLTIRKKKKVIVYGFSVGAAICAQGILSRRRASHRIMTVPLKRACRTWGS